MTIAAGFVCRDGILLGTDSQFSAYDKMHREKLALRPVGVVNVGFAFSGDEDYARTAIEDGVEAAIAIPYEEQNVWTVRKALRRAMRRMITDYSSQSHLDQSQKPEFLIAIGAPDGVRLFSSRETAFSPVETFDCRGTGGYLADYVIRAARFTQMAGIADVLPIAIRAIAAAKRHDLHSGDGSQFCAVRADSAISIAGYELDACDDAIAHFEQWSHMFFTTLGDHTLSKDEFALRLARFNAEMGDVRKALTVPGSPYRALLDQFSRRPTNSESSQT